MQQDRLGFNLFCHTGMVCRDQGKPPNPSELQLFGTYHRPNVLHRAEREEKGRCSSWRARVGKGTVQLLASAGRTSFPFVPLWTRPDSPGALGALGPL